MNILAKVPLRSILHPGAVQCKILSERTLRSRCHLFIESTDWDKYLYHKAIDKICLGAVILSMIYFCFHSGARLTGRVLQYFG